MTDAELEHLAELEEECADRAASESSLLDWNEKLDLALRTIRMHMRGCNYEAVMDVFDALGESIGQDDP